MLRVNRISQFNRALHFTQYNQNHYKTLNVDRYATTEEIKKAHKALARLHHPDRPGGDKEKFIDAQEAFEVLSKVTERADYDREIFGKIRETDEEVKSQFYPGAPGVWVRENGEEHVSQSYQQAMHQFERMEQKAKTRMENMKNLFYYAAEKPLHAALMLVAFVAIAYIVDKGVRAYLLWLCSDYLYDQHERQIEIPNTPGYDKKMKYIERIISNVPEEVPAQYDLFGHRRDWLIEFYSINTRCVMRGEIATLENALRYMPFVGFDFLAGNIPLNPADDFRSDSAKCLICEFVYGVITKVYPSEFMEQHSQRPKEFLRNFLPNKCKDVEVGQYKEEDPNYVNRFTGKKNVDGRQYRVVDGGYGDTIHNREDVYGDSNYNSFRKRWHTGNY